MFYLDELYSIYSPYGSKIFCDHIIENSVFEILPSQFFYLCHVFKSYMSSLILIIQLYPMAHFFRAFRGL